jgi:hypothetical protein
MAEEIAIAAADCQSMFQRADVNRDGALRADEAQLFTDAMAQAQLSPQDASSITQDEFLSACRQNAFANIDPASAARDCEVGRRA